MSQAVKIEENNSEFSWCNDIAEAARSYKENGFLIVDDFLPNEKAEELYELYASEEEWEHHDQVREGHFKHVFQTINSPYFPGEEEAYMAKFGRSEKLEQNTELKNIFNDYFKPALAGVSRLALSDYDVRCYQLKQGDFYRTHIDDYAGDIGCIYYINKKWVWDWGGILHVGSDEDNEAITALFPKFNRAIFVDHGGFRFPHFISTVSEFAQNPRYTMISFNK
jgi:Rps23 Pro-64 3,4-dihydroxylase Tpa1-like proline 4-hydroxylase